MVLLRKYAAWLILATMAGVAGTWLVYASRPVRYLSTAEVDVEPHLVAIGTPVEPNMGTEEQVATSGLVLAGAARALHTTSASLAGHVTASVGKSTGSTATGTANVLTIGCAMPTPTAAQRCAGAAAYSYMNFRNDAGMSRFTRAHDPLQVTLITPATRVNSPVGPGKRTLLPIGALLGLALGLGGMFVRDHFDKRVREGGDLERCLGAPVLAAIPRARPRHAVSHVRSRHASPPPLTCLGPPSPVAEAYRYLREHLDSLLKKTSAGGAMVLVASPQPRDGRTHVAANLAGALAEAGARVTLVDADLLRPSLSRVFNVSQRPGLTELLSGEASLRDVAVPLTGLPGLRVVTAGDLGDPPAQALNVAQLNRIFGTIRAESDVVVVDSAPVLTVSQAITLARMSDVVTVVADVSRTTRDAVSTAAQQIRASGPRIILGVLNGVPSTRNGQMWHGAVRAPDSAVPSPTVSQVLAAAVPSRWANGQGPAAIQQQGTDPESQR